MNWVASVVAARSASKAYSPVFGSKVKTSLAYRNW